MQVRTGGQEARGQSCNWHGGIRKWRHGTLPAPWRAPEMLLPPLPITLPAARLLTCEAFMGDMERKLEHCLPAAGT